MKKPEKKKTKKENDLTKEQAKVEFGKRMDDFVLAPVDNKKRKKSKK